MKPAASAGDRLLVISPVRNEAERIGQVIDAVARQTRRPDRWMIVDDHSTDGTLAIARAAEAELPFLTVIEAPEQSLPAGADRLEAAADAVAFNWALKQAEDNWDYVAKLDGDIVLSEGHYERALAEFARDPTLGLIGCYLEVEDDGRWVRQAGPDYHVNGAVKLYRRACFEEIGERQGQAGILERLGWDTIDETYARMAGWRTRSLDDIRAKHLKPSGSVGGELRGKARHGLCVWICHYPLWIVLARGARLALARPYVVGGAAFVLGYLRAALLRRPRVPDPAFRRYVRRELRGRLRPAAR